MFTFVFKINETADGLVKDLKTLGGFFVGLEEDYTFFKFSFVDEKKVNHVLRYLKEEDCEFEYIEYEVLKHSGNVKKSTLSLCVEDDETGEMIY